MLTSLKLSESMKIPLLTMLLEYKTTLTCSQGLLFVVDLVGLSYFAVKQSHENQVSQWPHLIKRFNCYLHYIHNDHVW